MPVCNKVPDAFVTTASHRPAIWLPAFMLLQSLDATLLRDDGADEREPAPVVRTVHEAINLITDVPVRLLGDPDISTFFGEIHVSWRNGPKQIVLMFFPNRPPLVHHYVRVPNAAIEHDIEEANADSLVAWLTWLRE